VRTTSSASTGARPSKTMSGRTSFRAAQSRTSSTSRSERMFGQSERWTLRPSTMRVMAIDGR
jgi:hypothetical protein